MKTDSLFYRIFSTAPVLFFQLLEQEYIPGYHFESIEVKQTAFRLDGVFVPPEEHQEQPTYFIEVQFQKDEQLYHRLLAEVRTFLFRHPHRSNWKGVIVYSKSSLQPSSKQGCEELFTSQRIREIYLDQLEVGDDLGLGLLKLIVEPETTAVEKAKTLLTQVKQSDSMLSQQTILEIIETTIVYKFPRLSREEIAKMLGLVELQETRVYQEGLEDGRKEGRQEEACGLIIKQLQRKIGTLSPQVKQKIEGLSLAQLETLGEALLDFNQLSDLQSWLKVNRK